MYVRLSSVRLSPAFHSLWSLLVLLCVVLLLVAGFFRNNSLLRAPDIPGVDWRKHSDALLIVYPVTDGCSTCNLSIYGWTQKATEHNLDAIVITTHSTPELQELKSHPPAKARLKVITGVDETLIKRFSSGDKIGGVRIRQGRIIHRQIGGTPPASFFTFLPKEVNKNHEFIKRNG
jgi:hypothetical protein